MTYYFHPSKEARHREMARIAEEYADRFDENIGIIITDRNGRPIFQCNAFPTIKLDGERIDRYYRKLGQGELHDRFWENLEKMPKDKE